MASERTISSSVTVAAPPEKVWDFVSDTSRYPEWVEGAIEMLRTDGIARVGSTYVDLNRIAGPWKATIHWHVSEVDSPRRQVHDGEGLPTVRDLRVVMELEPSGQGTEFTLSLRYRPRFGPLGTLIDKAVAGSVKEDGQRTVENMAAIVTREASAAPAASGSEPAPTSSRVAT
jgi:uncharacterized protein YndB with AHSA1/START domain